MRYSYPPCSQQQKSSMSHKLLKSTLIVSSMTLISRFLGFMRDIILAAFFGASPSFDAFLVAFKIPNFIRRLFGEGAFTQAFVPVLTEYQAHRSQKEVHQFINALVGSMSVILIVIIALTEIIAPLIIMVFAPGFVRDPVCLTYAIHMLRIISPYLLLIALTAFSGATLNTFNRFAIPAFTPALLNAAMIAVVWFLAPHVSIPIYVLAWSVLVGGFLQLVTQLPFLYHLGLLPIPKWKWHDPGVIRVLKLMIPALFGVSIAQISLLIDNFFASFLAAGSISWLYYSDRLTYLPLGVIGATLATVVSPNLSRYHILKSTSAYSATLDWALRMTVLIGIPSAVALFILAGPLLATLIYHGAFMVHDVLMTQRSLWAFSVGLPSFMLVKILASAFYSSQNIKTPVKIAIVAVGANLILNVLLIHPFAYMGLALATSLASTFNAGLLLYVLLRRSICRLSSNWSKLIFQSVVANFMMGFVIVWFSGDMGRWLAWSVKERIWHLLAVILLGFFTYLVTLWISGLRLSDLRPSIIID
ncbi:MAG: murein biosynthesis integral membrane protein MurJ [Coxiella endosymbiont of Dermacentor silvarum]